MSNHSDTPHSRVLPLWSFRAGRRANLEISTRADVEHSLMARVVDDPHLRAKLSSAPKDVLRGEFGVELPDKLEIVVLEESSARTFLIIPENPAAPAADHESLQSVAATVLAGRTPWWLSEEQAVELVVRVWEDCQLAQTIEQEPAAALEALDITAPLGVEVVIWRERPTQIFLVLPLIPPEPSLRIDETWWKAANTGRRVKIAASLAPTQPDPICLRAACTSPVCFCTFSGSTA